MAEAAEAWQGGPSDDHAHPHCGQGGALEAPAKVAGLGAFGFSLMELWRFHDRPVIGVASAGSFNSSTTFSPPASRLWRSMNSSNSSARDGSIHDRRRPHGGS